MFTAATDIRRTFSRMLNSCSKPRFELSFRTFPSRYLWTTRKSTIIYGNWRNPENIKWRHGIPLLQARTCSSWTSWWILCWKKTEQTVRHG